MNRAEAQERTHEALLDVAREELFEGHWERTSLEQLALRAKVTKQTLLRHFGSKDGLLLKALSRGAEEVLKQRWSAPAGDVETAVETLLDHYEKWGRRALRIGAWQGGSAPLAQISSLARRVHYDWVDYAFAPYLERLEEGERWQRRAQLIAVCDVQTWWLLSNDLGLVREEVHAVLLDMVERLIG